MDLVQMHDLEWDIQTTDEAVMSQSYQKLAQSLIGIKNNISECIDSLENTTQINSCIIHTMQNTVKEIDHAQKAMHAMKQFNFKNMDIDLP